MMNNQAFLTECTPGYYNNEGNPAATTACSARSTAAVRRSSSRSCVTGAAPENWKVSISSDDRNLERTRHAQHEDYRRPTHRSAYQGSVRCNGPSGATEREESGGARRSGELEGSARASGDAARFPRNE